MTDTTGSVEPVEAIRSRLGGAPSRYERVWLWTINAVGLVVVAAVAFDVGLVLGEGQTGVFRRALYPLVSPAVVLGVATADGNRRQALLAAGLGGGYLLVLAAVGTLGAALRTAPVYPLAGLVGGAGLAVGGWLVARRRPASSAGE